MNISQFQYSGSTSKTLSPRIEALRRASLEARAEISPERALLMTEFYKKGEYKKEAVAIQRARAFECLLTHKTICIQPGELIVGERGPFAKATPTYPEICLHSLDDLDILHNRPKVSFYVSEETRCAYRDQIIPFWKGKTQRERIFEQMNQAWLKAYQAGVFTEFQEQRAPGHTVAGDGLFRRGMLDVIFEIRKTRLRLEKQPDTQPEQIHELEAMEITAKAIIAFAQRHADALSEMAENEKNLQRKAELKELQRICMKVPANAPESFHEALQHYWFIHLGVITELNPWDSFSPGRLDQHLISHYEREIQHKSLSPEWARELLQAFWIKFNNHPSPPKMGVTAKESSTYTDFSLINLGGVKDDGQCGVNALSFMMLDVVEEMRLLQPSSMVQISKKSPDTFLQRALHICRTGFGQPSFFNTEAIVQQLLSQGKTLTDARRGGASGCVETGAFGTEAYTLSGYFNLNKILEITLFKGLDPLSGELTGLDQRQQDDPHDMESLYKAFTAQLKYFADIKIAGNNRIEALYARYLPVPFLSLLIDDCVEKAVDYNAGGARYNTSYIQGVGLGSITDSLSALESWVFQNETKSSTEISTKLSFSAMREMLSDNFQSHQAWRQRILYETPHWGNNNPKADKHARRVFEIFHDAVTMRPSFRGGVFRINMLPTTCHVYFGEKTGATPDGRLAGQPFSEGISPVQGRDLQGPVAVLQSAACIDHIRTGGTLLNQKFSPEFFHRPESMQKLIALIRSWFRLDGHHIQFNVVDAETLRHAQLHPEQHRDLIVRVAGYSDYFNDLDKSLQDEIIQRTEQGI